MNDADCGICGWVCSTARGNICIPGAEGDPGHCTTSHECACIGQTCAGSACTPAANPACWCNGDCPDGDVCDQLLFTCHPASAIYCGRGYDGYDYGAAATGPACGCNGICGESEGKLICQPQQDTLPLACASDLDCGSCYHKQICANGSCIAAGGGWCTDSRDVFPISGQDGGGAGSKSTGCSVSGTSDPGLALLLAAEMLRRRRRR